MLSRVNGGGDRAATEYSKNRMEVDTIAEIAPEIWRHAVDTFGDGHNAALWMRQPLSELGYRTPETMLRSGRTKEAEAILIRIDYGVFG